MRLWEEGYSRDERIELRQQEDELRERLLAEYWRTGNRDLFAYLDWQRKRRDEIDMARGRPKKGNEKADKLLTALAFVKVAVKDTGQGEYQKHLHIANGLMVAYDGIMAAGHPIEEDMQAYPNFEQFNAALRTCGKQLSFTLEGSTIEVTGDKIKATVQCLPPDAMHVIAPEPLQYGFGDEIKTALDVCMAYTREGATLVHETSVLLSTGSAIGTNGKALVEYWHGVNLPDMVLPRAFCAAVVKAPGKLVGFGWGDGRAVTFHFDDGSWLRTQLYGEGYPMSAKTILNIPSAPVTPPADFLKAVAAVAAFSEDGTIVVEGGTVHTFHMNSAAAAEYEVKDLTTSRRLRYTADLINKVADRIKTVDFESDPDKLLWFGDSVRGCILRIIETGENR